MDEQLERIVLSVEMSGRTDIDYEHEHTEVIVQFRNGDVYVAPFFPFRSLERLRQEQQVAGEQLDGKYVWVERMVLVEHCRPELIEQVVEDLMREGDFFTAFRKL